jgi:hypothetical protein
VGGEWPFSVLSTAVDVRGDVPTIESAMAAVSVGHSSSVSVVTVIGVGGDPFSFIEVDSNRVLCLRILLLASCWSLGLLALFFAIAFFGILTGGVAKCAKERKKEEGEKNTTGANTNSHVESEQRAFGGYGRLEKRCEKGGFQRW